MHVRIIVIVQKCLLSQPQLDSHPCTVSSPVTTIPILGIGSRGVGWGVVEWSGEVGFVLY